MQVIRRRDHYAVDVFLLVEHLAEVGVAGGLREMDGLQALRACDLILHPLPFRRRLRRVEPFLSSAGWWRRASGEALVRVCQSTSQRATMFLTFARLIRFARPCRRRRRPRCSRMSLREASSRIRDHVAWDDLETGRGCSASFKKVRRVVPERGELGVLDQSNIMNSVENSESRPLRAIVRQRSTSGNCASHWKDRVASGRVA